ncbi:MAG: VWA domain-containing protein [Planctomycetota bacterium]|nr:VWA domain-containing protein [Planctomycetota bacterium]
MLELTVLSEYSSITDQKDNFIHLLLRLDSKEREKEETSPPLNLALILDRSGSMTGSKLRFTKVAAGFLIDRLRPVDQLAILAYDHEVEVLCPLSSGDKKALFKEALTRLSPRGYTNLSAAWLYGLSMIEKSKETRPQGSIHRTLVLTDGQANQGICNVDRLVSLGQQFRERGVGTSTFGFGDDFNEDLLTKLAENSGGHFYYIDHPDKAPSAFISELGELKSVLGQNLEVVVRCENGISLVRNYSSYPGDSSPAHQVWRMGDLYANDSKLLLFSVKIPKGYGSRPIVQIGVCFHDAETGREQRIEKAVVIPVTEHGATPATQNLEVIKERLILEAALAKDRAISFADQGKIHDAKESLRQSSSLIRNSLADCLLALSKEEKELLSVEAGQCDDLVKNLEEKHYSTQTRKLMRTQSFLSKSQRGVYKRESSMVFRKEDIEGASSDS